MDTEIHKQFLSNALELRSEAAQEFLTKLHDIAKQGQLTLVFAAHDAAYSNAVVLHDLLLQSC